MGREEGKEDVSRDAAGSRSPDESVGLSVKPLSPDTPMNIVETQDFCYNLDGDVIGWMRVKWTLAYSAEQGEYWIPGRRNLRANPRVEETERVTWEKCYLS